MTVLTGFRLESPLTKTTSERLSHDLAELTVDYWQTPRYSEHPTHTKEMRPFTRSYAYVSNVPVEMGWETKVGNVARGYKYDLYFRVHVKPRLLDFGNLINTEVEEVALWNAWFVPIAITASTDPTQFGLSVSFVDPLVQIPYILKPNEETIMEVTADISGPPTVDGEYTLTIGGIVYTVRMVGRRILLWPFPPNWQNPVDMTWSFKSWVLRAASGKVQTGSTWGNHPRREIDYSSLLKREDSQRADNLLMGWAGRMYGVVAWPEKGKTTAPVVAGTRTIAFDTSKKSYKAGSFCVLYVDSGNYETAEIESVSPGGLVVTSDLLGNWPTGTRIYPVFAGTINNQVSYVRHTDSVSEISVQFECEPSSTPSNTDTPAASALYRGHELYLGRTNWRSPQNVSYDTDRQNIDFGTARFYAFSESDWTPQQRSHEWFIKSHDDMIAFLQFLGRREGVAKPVYMPTGYSDMTIIADPLLASSHIDIKENDYSIVAAHPGRRDVMIQMYDGTYHLRRIVGAQKIAGGLRVLFEEAWAANIDRALIRRISYLGLWRLATNKATIRFETESKGSVTLTLIMDRND